MGQLEYTRNDTMINIGIDVGKFKHCASVIDDKTGEILIKPFFFNNDPPLIPSMSRLNQKE